MTRFTAIVVIVIVVVMLGCSLDPKERANPFDPDNPLNYGDPLWLEVSIVDTVIDSSPVKAPLLDWRDVDQTLLDEFHVYRRRTIFDSILVMVATVAPDVSVYLDVNTRLGVRYDYRVVAVMLNNTDSVLSAIESVYLR